MNDLEFKEALRLIDKLYKELYRSYEVTHRAPNVTNKFENLGSYIERLEKIHTRAKGNPKLIKQLKNYYYYKYVIKPEDIPESYYEHQQQLAFERGQGRIYISDYMKKEYQKKIINDQKKSLDMWLDYFLSDDSNYMPMWAKFWAFEGMLKLGTFDKEKGSFNKRSKTTTNIFADLNREALALSIDYMRKSLNKQNIDDKDLEKLLKDGSFGKIYLYFIKKLEENKMSISDSDEGIWIKYNQGSDHMPLVKSLQGYNTGWCTAGESTARSQLKKGDFYVYYTKDENGEYKVPRIAIRMEGDKIGEIRGIAKDQNLESNMEKIVEEKIKDFPDKDKYYKKVSDMKKLTIIYNKNKNNIELSKEELMFLYEVNDIILSFGWDIDPRIQEIIKARNFGDDFTTMFGCSKDQVASSMKELLEKPDEIVVLKCDLVLKDDKVKFPNLKYILGNAHCESLKSAEVIPSIELIQGNTYFNSIKNANGLENLKSIKGDAHFESLEDGSELRNLEIIGFTAYFYSLKTLKGLENLKYVGWDAHFNSLLEKTILPNLIIERKIFLLDPLLGDIFPKNTSRKFRYDDFEYDLFKNDINVYQNFKNRILYIFNRINKTRIEKTGLFKKIVDISDININNIDISSKLFQDLYNQCNGDFNISEFFASEYSDYLACNLFEIGYYNDLFTIMSDKFLKSILKNNCSFFKVKDLDNDLSSIIYDYEEKHEYCWDTFSDTKLSGRVDICNDFDTMIELLKSNSEINLDQISESNQYVDLRDGIKEIFLNYFISNHKYTKQDFIDLFNMIAKDNSWMFAPESLQFEIMDEIVKLAHTYNVEINIAQLVEINNVIISKRMI